MTEHTKAPRPTITGADLDALRKATEAAAAALGEDGRPTDGGAAQDALQALVGRLYVRRPRRRR